MTAQCGKGWTERCAHAKSKKCSCRCGGENHGKAVQREEGGKPREEINELLALVVEETIRPLAFTPRIIERYDYIGLHGRRAETHLTICGKVVIATEREDNPGASITNAAENLWEKVRAQFGDDIVAIEHYPAMRYGGTPARGGLKEEWDLVTIVNGTAEWESLTREAVVEFLSGQRPPVAEMGVHAGDDDDPLGDPDDDCDDAPEGRVFRPGEELALADAIDSYATRTPPHPFDGDEL